MTTNTLVPKEVLGVYRHDRIRHSSYVKRESS